MSKRIMLYDLSWKDMQERVNWCNQSCSEEYRWANTGEAINLLGCIRDPNMRLDTIWEFDSYDDLVMFTMVWS